MNCKEVKIWINITAEIDLSSPPENVVNHINNCSECSDKLNSLSAAYQYVSTQKLEQLSEERTSQIIEQLELMQNNKVVGRVGQIFISKIAVILIIAFGLVVGVVAGSSFPSDSDKEKDPWASEFSLLSDNTQYSLFE